MVPSMLIKEPGCQTKSRLTEKLAEVWENTRAPYYMATPEEKQTDMHSKMEWQMYLSENLLGVNLVVMNYKIRHNKNQPAMRPARYSLAWPRALVNHSWSMNIATFSTRDLWEQGCKSYVASYRANEGLVIPWMFSRELRQWRWFTKVFFQGRFPIYGMRWKTLDLLC